jgi:DNA-binding MarR family transcriptional regulator
LEYTDIIISLRKILRAINIENKRVEKENGISIPQLLCLQFLSKQQGLFASPKAIKEHLQLNASTVSGIVARLEKKGFVAKLPNASDRRMYLIALTAKGDTLLNDAPPLLHQKLSNQLKSLSPAKVAEIQASIQLLVGMFDAEKLDAAPIVMLEDPTIK